MSARIHSTFDIHAMILGRSESGYQFDDGASIQIFADSFAKYLRQLRKERDDALLKVGELERECEGLRLALKRLP